MSGVNSLTIKKALALQPLVTSLNLNDEFRNYRGGYLDEKVCGNGGHQVVFVGWGIDD